MPRKAKEYKWIIALSGSEWDDVDISFFVGTEKQAREKLVEVVLWSKREAEEWSWYYDYGTEDPKDIEKRSDGSLHAEVIYVDGHDHYKAIPVEKIPDFSDEDYKISDSSDDEDEDE